MNVYWIKNECTLNTHWNIAKHGTIKDIFGVVFHGIFFWIYSGFVFNALSGFTHTLSFNFKTITGSICIYGLWFVSMDYNCFIRSTKWEITNIDSRNFWIGVS